VSTRFSVLIPTYNREKHVRQTIESVLAQTCPDFEVIVVDDGSTDGTPAMLQAYGSRVRALNQANQGPEVARNHAASVAQGEYLVMLDSDDLLMPCALATYDRVIQALDSPPVIIGSMKYFHDGNPLPTRDDGDGRVEVWKCPDFLAKDVSVGLSNSRIIIRKSVLDEVGGLRPTTPKTFHLDDFNLILKTGTYGPCAIVKHPTTVAYRTHDSNSIHGLESMVNGILVLVADERAGRFPGGAERRFGRYTIIGGIAQRWVEKAFRFHRPGQALRLALRSAPMLAAAVYNRFTRKYRKPATELVLLEAPIHENEVRTCMTMELGNKSGNFPNSASEDREIVASHLNPGSNRTS
jgi:glycosyltransferase involved in cell wall biosynthesis